MNTSHCLLGLPSFARARSAHRPVGWRAYLLVGVVMLACTGHARADITLTASAAMVQPALYSTYYAGTLGYTTITFEATNTWVSAQGSAYDYVSVNWTMMIGWDEGNQGVRTDVGTTEVVQLDSDGRWQRTAILAGSDDVNVGTRHARTLSEIWVTGTQNRDCNSLVREFYVVAEAPPGGGGMGGD